jgi:hypothetical protein
MAGPRLFHVSEDAAIGRFDPRPPPSPDAGVVGDAVWAIAEPFLPNYLLPRDCPRICFRAGPQTSDADRDRFLGAAAHVVAFEADWLERVKTARLALYEMPLEPFAEALGEAGYWISRESVTPARLTMIDDALGALADRGVEVRVLQDFWPLSDAVAGSSLRFSIIRKRNARPRTAGAI